MLVLYGITLVIITAITKWERAYADLVELCDGNFRLDDKGKIASLKRLFVIQSQISSGLTGSSYSLPIPSSLTGVEPGKCSFNIIFSECALY